MKKTKMTTKALSMLLTVVLLFTTISVGIIVPDAKIEAKALEANSVATLNSAIATANTNGTGVVTEIKLTGDITYNGTLASFTALRTANVLFDFNGYSLKVNYTHSEGRATSGRSDIQLPSENANKSFNGVDTLTTGMFIVNAGSTLQIINTKPGNICTMQVYTDFVDDAEGEYNWVQEKSLDNKTSASLIYCEGTLIIGDENSQYNDFNLYAHSSCRNTHTGNTALYYRKSATVNVSTVTINNSSARFKMYGGKIQATGVARARRGSYSDVLCFALNVNDCYSAEIYGGEVSIPKCPVDNNNGISQATGKASEGATARISAIRCASPYLYIFKVKCAVQTQCGKDSSKDNDLYTSCIYTTDAANAPYVYGADLSYSAYRGDNSSTAENYGYIVRGAYKLASNGTINPSSASGSDYGATNPGTGETGTGSIATYTVFIGNNGVVKDSSNNIIKTDMHAENGIDMFSYNSFREYLAAYTSTAKDVYYGDSVMTTNGDANKQVGSTKYLLNGYTQKNWAGKTHPGSAYSVDCYTPETAVITGGGSLFLVPLWEETVYNITHIWNDEDYGRETNTLGTTGLGNVTSASKDSCPSTYTIDSISENVTLGEPVRPGYTFNGWEIMAVTYPDTDTVNSSSLGRRWKIGDTHSFNAKLKGANGHITIKALWSEDKYTASFDFDKGYYTGSPTSTSDSKQYTINTAFTFPEYLEKPHYTFDNCYKVKTAGGSWAKNETLYAAGDASVTGNYGNVTFIAQYTPVQYTVTYDSMLGSSVDDPALKTYNIESTHTLPEITRTGYTFVGWKPVTSSGTWDATITYPAGTSFKDNHGNVTFEAQWESSTYKLTLDVDATVNVSGGKTEYEYAYSTPLTITNPTKTGYDFSHWVVTSTPAQGESWKKGDEFKPEKNANDEFESFVVIPANKVGNVTLAPVFTPTTYTVSFISNGGVGCEPFEFNIEQTINLPVTTKKGYTLKGWSVTTDEGNWSIKAEAFANSLISGGAALTGVYGDATLTAEWEIAQFAATLKYADGETPDSTVGFTTEKSVTLPIPTRLGYTFKGWTVTAFDADSNWVMDEEYKISNNEVKLPIGKYGNVTLTAQWEHKPYTIHYLSDGSVPGDTTYYIDTTSLTLAASVYSGYSFSHWEVTSIDQNESNWTIGETFEAGTPIYNKYGNVTLTARFTPVDYTIIYKFGDAEKTFTYNMNTQVTIKNFDDAELGFDFSGYTFGGWKVTSLENGAGWSGVYEQGTSFIRERYGNVVLEPVLAATEYTVTFIPDGGTPYANLSYTIESTDTLPADPVKTGYVFNGWKATAVTGNWEENKLYAGGTTVQGMYGDVTLTADWTPEKYLITWTDDNGVVIDVTEVEYGTMPSHADASKAPTAQYTYTFAGWEPALTTVTGPATYKAKFNKTVNSYTVTWVYETDDNGTVKTDTVTYKYGETPVFNNGVNPEKTSVSGKYYRFVGWTPAVASVTGDVTYTAQFKEISAPVTVAWIIEGVRYETKWTEGETPSYVGTPVKPDKDGMKYTFSHWTPAIVEVQANTNYEYTAVFTEAPQGYTAEFDLNGGSYAGVTTYTYNKTVTLNMPQPSKAGYTFTGWEVVETDGTWAKNVLLTSITYSGFWGNVSFVATYAPAVYTITVENTDGTTTDYTYNIESTDALPALTQDGYVLTGWMVVSAEGNWVAGDSISADKVLTGMYGNVTLHPIWTARLYKINWVSEDTTQTVEFRYGAPVITYPPIAKAGYTAQWDAQVPAVMPAEDLTFNAVYVPIQYYLRFNTSGGSAVENFYYDITSTGTLPVSSREGATFKGWKVSAGTGNWDKDTIYKGGASLNGFYGNMTFTAVWEIELHTVTWVAGDVTRVTKWYHGAVPSYDGTPYKSPDGQYSYVFAGWDKAIVTVTEDITYTALFNKEARKYVVKWSVDGNVIEEAYLNYNVIPEDPTKRQENPLPVPTRPSTAEFDFTFIGWSPEIAPVTGDITYYAVFDPFTKLQGLRLDKSAVFIAPDEEAVLAAILSPSTATVQDVDWFSSDNNVVTVDGNGKLKATGSGEALVRVQSKDGSFKAYCFINVAPIVSTRVAVSANGVSTTQLPGNSIQLYATVEPDNVTNKNIKWSSKDTAVAMVDANGLVTFGEKVGTTTITAVADGYGVGTIEVTVTKESAEVEDKVKTYTVMFLKSTSAYVIAGTTYESINIIYPEGSTVEFVLTEPHFVTLNGHQFERDVDGVFRIKNLDRNYSVVSVERADLGFEEEPDAPVKSPTFFDKLKDFFRSIVEFFRNLFG